MEEGRKVLSDRRSASAWIDFWFHRGGALQIVLIVGLGGLLVLTSTVSIESAAIAALVVLGIGFIAGSFAFLWETRSESVESVRESRRRSRPAGAIRRESTEPIIGVYLREGRRLSFWHGNYVWITAEARKADSATFLVVARRPRILGVSVVKGPAFSELEDYLAAARIGILPLGSYSDRVWARYFSDYVDDPART